MSTQPKGTQPVSNKSTQTEDDVLIEEGERDFRYLMAILVGAFGTFALIFLVSFIADLLGCPYFLSGL